MLLARVSRPRSTEYVYTAVYATAVHADGFDMQTESHVFVAPHSEPFRGGVNFPTI